MIHDIFIAKSEILKAAVVAMNLGTAVVCTIPPRATIISHNHTKDGGYRVIYETPDETPCTISVGLAE